MDAQEAAETLHRRIASLLDIAEAAECRVAISAPIPRICGCDDYDWDFVHVMLMPGEKPPRGESWTIYERHADTWQGRRA